MLTSQNLSEMAGRLYDYDVRDGGWEGDPEAAVAPCDVSRNLIHVGFHLTDTLERKDFFDHHTANAEIAPDCVQYALRFVRWGGLVLDGALPARSLIAEVKETTERLDGLFPERGPFAAVMKANAEIARNRHDADHASTSEKAREQLPTSLYRAAGFLIYAAEQQAEFSEFDLVDAFDARIQSLRDRFKITRKT